MPKLTRNGQPTIGYIRELQLKNRDELTDKEKQMLDEANEVLEESAKKLLEAFNVDPLITFAEAAASVNQPLIAAQESFAKINQQLTSQVENIQKFSLMHKRAIEDIGKFSQQTILFKKKFILPVIEVNKTIESIVSQTNFSNTMEEIARSFSEIPDLTKSFEVQSSLGRNISWEVGASHFETEDHHEFVGKATIRAGIPQFALEQITEIHAVTHKTNNQVAKLLATTIKDNERKENMLNELLGYFEGEDGLSLIQIRDIKFIGTKLYINGTEIDIPSGSQRAICETFFSDKESMTNVWEYEAILDPDGLFDVDHNDIEKMYHVALRLTDKIFKKTGIRNFFIYTKSKIYINPQYHKMLFTH